MLGKEKGELARQAGAQALTAELNERTQRENIYSFSHGLYFQVDSASAENTTKSTLETLVNISS